MKKTETACIPQMGKSGGPDEKISGNQPNGLDGDFFLTLKALDELSKRCFPVLIAPYPELDEEEVPP